MADLRPPPPIDYARPDVPNRPRAGQPPGGPLPPIDYARPDVPKRPATGVPRRSSWEDLTWAVLGGVVVFGGVGLCSFSQRSPRTRDGRRSAAITDASMLEAALDASRADTGRIPTRGEGLRARVNAPPGTAGWKGPYIKRGVPNDPWGHPYVYHPGGGNGCRVLSVGPDATEGTADDVRP